jgi:2-aminomuconate deaminase
VGPRLPGTNAIPGNVHDVHGKLTGYDIEAQCRQVFANVGAVLAASGARWQDLVDVTVFLTDMAHDFAAYNRVYAEYFPDPATAPCRTTLGITALPTPIAIELKCIAALPRSSS